MQRGPKLASVILIVSSIFLMTACGGSVSAASPDGKAILPTSKVHVKITGSLAITSTVLPNAFASSGYTTSLLAQGGSRPYKWQATSALPPGLSLASSGSLSGTPTTPGAFTFAVALKDGSSPTQVATGSIQLTVIAASTMSSTSLNLTSASVPTATVGQPYSTAFGVTGGTQPYTFTAISTLPAGLSLSSGGLLSGTPKSSGQFTFSVKVQDSSSPALSTTGTYTIVISAGLAPLIVATSSLPGATLGSSYSTSLSASGGALPYTWSAATALPAGLSLNSNGTLSGTPSASGTFNVGFQVADSTLPALTATKTLQLAVTGGSSTLLVSTAALPSGISGTSYNASLTATGGTAPYKWSIASGQLPTGLLLSSTGAISGTPSTTGLSNFTVKVSDSSSTVQSASAALSINIANPPTSSSSGGACGPAFNPLAASYSASDVYVPSNYQAAGSPSMASVQTDPQFGCNYWKVADNSVHEYSAMAVIDSNDRWVVTIPTASTGITGPAVIRDLNTGNAVCTVSGVGQGMRWGINDPDVLWYPNAQDNNLYVYYVTAHNGPAGSHPACTMVLFDTQTSTVFGGHQMTNCFGESDVASMNGSDVLCLSGSANDDTYGATVRRYNTSTKTLSPALNGTNTAGTASSYYFGTQCNDYGDMTFVNGNILLVYNGMTVASGCTVRDLAPHNYGGVDVFDGATGKYIRTVQTWGCGHGARGVDTDGSEIIACNNNWMDPNPPSGCDNGIVKTRIADSSQSCLLSYAHNLPPFPGGTPDVLREQLTSIHNNGGRHFNLLVSYTDNRGESGDPPPPLGTAYRGPNNDTALSSNWATQWGVIMNELLLVNLTNTQSSHHLVHHHNFWVGSGGVQYWSDAHGSMSRSGNYAVFDSSFGNTWPNLGVYVVKIR